MIERIASAATEGHLQYNGLKRQMRTPETIRRMKALMKQIKGMRPHTAAT